MSLKLNSSHIDLDILMHEHELRADYHPVGMEESTVLVESVVPEPAAEPLAVPCVLEDLGPDTDHITLPILEEVTEESCSEAPALASLPASTSFSLDPLLSTPV